MACGVRNSNRMPPATSRTPSRPLSTRPTLKVLSSAGDSGLAGPWAGDGAVVIVPAPSGESGHPGGRRSPGRSWCSSASWPPPGLVNLLGEAFQGLGAVLEPLVGGLGTGGTEQVPGTNGAVPAAQAVQALFFFVKLGERQLALRDLAGEFGLVLAAIRQELAPLGLALRGE